MKQIIPLNKQSKRAQRAFHNKRRGSWNGVDPVTRVVPSGKAYDRNRVKRETRGAVDRGEIWQSDGCFVGQSL